MSQVRISEISKSPVSIATEDYFPVVNSASFTTYRTPFLNLVNFMDATASYASTAITVSYVTTSSYSIYGGNVSSSISTSMALTTSYLFYIPQTFVTNSVSSSWASRSLNTLYSLTSSFVTPVPQTFVNYSVSSSWASCSISSSITATASYISAVTYSTYADFYNPPATPNNNVIWAWASFSGSNQKTDPIILNSSYNIKNIKFSYFDDMANWASTNAHIVKYGYSFQFITPVANPTYSAWGTVYWHRTSNGTIADKKLATSSVMASGLLAFPRPASSHTFPAFDPVHSVFMTATIFKGANDINGFTASFLNDQMTSDYQDYLHPDSWSLVQTEKASKVIGTIIVFGSGSI